MSQAINLQESTISLTVLQLLTDDIQQIKYEINQKIDKNPDNFINSSIILEPKIKLDDPTFLALLVEFLYQLQIVPIGIKTQDQVMQQQAEYAGLAVFSSQLNTNTTSSLTENSTYTTALIINNVRSGQQVYAKNRDLIVTGSVNPGAEVIADGNVHIYGQIKGKVFAGGSGSKQAKIFAYNLNPEMLSIAGLYQLSEDIDENYKQGFVEIFLDEETNQLNYKSIFKSE